MLLFTALAEIVAIGFLPFIIIFTVLQVEYNGIRALGMLLMGGATGLNLFAIYFATLPVARILMGLLDKAAGAEKKEECCCGEAGLGEKEVRELVKEGVDAHVEEYHAEQEDTIHSTVFPELYLVISEVCSPMEERKPAPSRPSNSHCSKSTSTKPPLVINLVSQAS